MLVAHFVKRELETLFVHKFSAATMPFFNIFKNSAHYWLLSGFLIAYFTYWPTASTAHDPHPVNAVVLYAGIACFLVGEVGNLYTHLILSSLRSKGGSERGIPKGIGFDVVTCPNYMFEALAWAGIWLTNWNWSTGVFVVVAVGQMALWAKKKESRYRKELGGKYKKKRYSMIPGTW